MSYVKTLPEALAAAAAQLEGIGNSFSAESSAAAGSTTDVVPAASDEVSAMQAGVFSTYGQLYQTVSAQAQTIHQQFVNLMNQSSGSYAQTEAANQAGAGANSLSNAASSAASTSAAPTNPIESLANFINGVTSSLSGSVLNSNITNLSNVQVGNWASAGSDLIGLGGGGLLTAMSGPATAGADLGGLGAGLAGSVGPATGVGGAGAMGAAPVLAGVGQGASIGALSVPPSWAAGVPGASTPVTLAAQTFSTAPHAGGMGPGIAGMPAVANGGRGGSSFGAPRYGVKPKVMPLLPKPTLT